MNISQEKHRIPNKEQKFQNSRSKANKTISQVQPRQKTKVEALSRSIFYKATQNKENQFLFKKETQKLSEKEDKFTLRPKSSMMAPKQLAESHNNSPSLLTAQRDIEKAINLAAIRDTEMAEASYITEFRVQTEDHDGSTVDLQHHWDQNRLFLKTVDAQQGTTSHFKRRNEVLINSYVDFEDTSMNSQSSDHDTEILQTESPEQKELQKAQIQKMLESIIRQQKLKAFKDSIDAEKEGTKESFKVLQNLFKQERAEAHHQIKRKATDPLKGH